MNLLIPELAKRKLRMKNEDDNNPCPYGHDWKLIDTTYALFAECQECGEFSYDQDLINELLQEYLDE